MGVVGLKIPEGSSTEVDASGPDGVALGCRYGTGEETLVLGCGVGPVAQRCVLERERSGGSVGKSRVVHQG